MMGNFEIQKAVNVIVSGYESKEAPREELWQVVGNGYGNEQYAHVKLESFEKWNKGKGLHYRIVWVG